MRAVCLPSTPMPEPREPNPEGLRKRNKEDKLQRIREAAWALFSERGYEATTTRAVAERAQIGTGTLFLYAQSKSDLLFLVFRDQLEQLCQQGLATVPQKAQMIGKEDKTPLEIPTAAFATV